MHTLLLCFALSISPGQRVAAKGLYGKGIVAYEASRFDEALSDFTAAYALDPAPSLLFNLGQCHRKLGQWSDALAAYERYLRERPLAANRADVESLIDEVKKQLPPPPPAKAEPPTVVVVEAAPPKPPPPTASPPAPATTASSDSSPAVPAAATSAPAPPSHRSHWLGPTLAAASAVCAVFAVVGLVRVEQYLGNETFAANGNADNWGTASIALAVAAAGGTTAAIFTW